MGTVLKSFTLQGIQVEQLYYGDQNIHYRVDGHEMAADDFWKTAFVTDYYNQIIEKLNG